MRNDYSSLHSVERLFQTSESEKTIAKSRIVSWNKIWKHKGIREKTTIGMLRSVPREKSLNAGQWKELEYNNLSSWHGLLNIVKNQIDGKNLKQFCSSDL